MISTVRADFLDRFEDLPRLVAVRNRAARPWTLPPISADGLREIISGPARLAGLDVSEVEAAMVAEARDEPGALPLVQNALHWLWQQRSDGRLSGRLLNDHGGLAGILSQGADHLLLALGRQRERALELLFRLVKVDPEGPRHTRQRMPLADAVAVAGGGVVGRALVDHLAGTRARGDPEAVGPLRLITVADEAEDPTTGQHRKGWVNLIHETLIRSKGLDAKGQPQPYWPTLWRYIEQHQDRAARRERLQLLAREWKGRKGLARLFGLAGWLELVGFRGLAAPGSIEQRYLRWSTVRGLVLAGVLAMLVGVVGESLHWKTINELPLEAVWTRWAYKLGMVELPFPKPIPISDGTFMMGDEGSPDEQHRVTFGQPFFLGETEVTFAQYDAFATATGRARPNASGFGRDDRPVINVDWSDARAYARWLGAMTGTTCGLPSEAEWEYACRAGTTTAYAVPADTGGSNDIAGKGLANCSGCGREKDIGRTSPVGSFPANAWGLHDMHGNVFEWVEDCWHEGYKDAPGKGQAWVQENGGDCSSRVLRGGSWGFVQDYARCADRFRLVPGARNGDFGFRVVCSSPIVGH